jgi:HlyD family secretion protein
MTISRITGLALAVLLVAGAGAWWWRTAERDPEPQYRTAPIERGETVATVTSSGTINPVGSVSVGSQVSGQLREVLADFNSQVKAGEVIARIDPETFRHRVAQAEADLMAARAQVLVQKSQVEARRADLARIEVALVESRRDLARSEDLVKRGFISEAERDKAVSLVRSQEQELAAGRAAIEVAIAQVRNSEAVVRQREASVAAARVDLERTVIRSPVDGVVIKRSVDAGQTVAASLQAPELFVIARNLSDMQVDTSIDETDIGRIRTGQTASFTVDAYPGRRFSGTISQVRMAATNVQNVITCNVIVTFSNAEGLLLPGMTANVRIATETREDVLKVPNAALRLRIAGLTDVAEPSRPSGTAGQGGASVRAATSVQDGDSTPRPPGAGADQRGTGRIWLLENGEPRMVAVRTGISDGLNTEISAVGLQAGAEAIVGAAPTSARRCIGLRLF